MAAETKFRRADVGQNTTRHDTTRWSEVSYRIVSEDGATVGVGVLVVPTGAGRGRGGGQPQASARSRRPPRAAGNPRLTAAAAPHETHTEITTT